HVKELHQTAADHLVWDSGEQLLRTGVHAQVGGARPPQAARIRLVLDARDDRVADGAQRRALALVELEGHRSSLLSLGTADYRGYSPFVQSRARNPVRGANDRRP